LRLNPPSLPLRLFYGPLPLPGNEPRKGNKFSWSTLLESIHPPGRAWILQCSANCFMSFAFFVRTTGEH